VSYISTIITLNPGDVIATGTPGGVGHAQDPKRYLQEGQLLVTTIEGFGQLSNRVVEGSLMVAPTDQTTDPTLLEGLLQARRGTAFFARKLNELTDAEMDGTSLLDGWTRRHVAAHIG
jgi:hypothetical protein